MRSTIQGAPSRAHTQSFRLAAGALLALAWACTPSSSGGTPTFLSPRSTSQAVAGSTPLVVQERWLGYLAEEAGTGDGAGMTTTDFNGDGDFIDSIAVVVNMVTNEQHVLDVAATTLTIVDSQVYIVVDEAEDGKDRNGDGDMAMPDDIVLLHWSDFAGTLTYLATLGSPTTRLEVVGGLLYFVELPAVAPAAGETTLRYIDPAAPTTIAAVPNADAANPLDPTILGSDEGLLFLGLDETVEGRDLNADADGTPDDLVLGMVDSTDPAAAVLNSGLAVADANVPIRALPSSSDGWVVAFLVNELAQGATNFNDPGLFSGLWYPSHCTTGMDEDADTDDDVLHYLLFDPFVVDPVANAPVNTGLVGVDRVFAVNRSSKDYVGTISDEMDEGTCSLNNDGDQDDRVLRWTRADPTVPVLPEVDDNDMVAVANVPGGTFGITDLDGRFLAAIDEAADGRDYDGDVTTDNVLLGWIDPSAPTPTWVFDHASGAGISFIGTDWMAERPERDRLLVTIQEATLGNPANTGVQINADMDTDDSIPTFAVFDAFDPTDLDFPGPAIATERGNSGIVFANGQAFFRVDEADEGRDINGDGNANDIVLYRSFISGSNLTFLSTANDLGIPAAAANGNVGIAFIANEAMQGTDFNQDGDSGDLVVRHLRVGP